MRVVRSFMGVSIALVALTLALNAPGHQLIAPEISTGRVLHMRAQAAYPPGPSEPVSSYPPGPSEPVAAYPPGPTKLVASYPPGPSEPVAAYPPGPTGPVAIVFAHSGIIAPDV
ncbi:hypothetical protein [Tengunoibacter tsumagoiensis]|uniref:Uncharacterized protein n=1 Tax=Tengunoibacter tsumagoiensis TaxID=2014871 RepID=A0A402A2E2_9CHLR|nr:hypothetical protein [Tengunoibacter tsumagoiensis]GCE13232.1 hypothetical protein KTT_30910 [Tengunoibacter tsumagoiensis]